MSMFYCSDAKAGGRRKKLVQRRDNEQAGQEHAYQQQLAQQAAPRTNGFSHLHLSGLQPPFGTDTKGRRGGRAGKAGESGLTPSVGSIHLNGMGSDLSSNMLVSPYLFHQTPNGTYNASNVCRYAAFAL
jgi:hypothetical protein